MRSDSAANNKSSSQPPSVVGIGASAGGLEAFERFLTELPRRFDFAIVFIQHLSAKQKSLLPDVIRHKKPDVEIIEISDGMKIRPGRIYLSPPGKEIRIQKGTLRLSPCKKVHLCLPVDTFFESLADELGERAIAVILSGAGADGARGTLCIKMAGGTVFAQNPETAEFQGMPQAAIHTGQTDGVLSPEDIAQEILKMQGAESITASAGNLVSPKDFQPFYRVLREKTGYTFDHYKKTVVARRLRRRMQLQGVTDPNKYLRIIEEKPDEASLLASDLMIGVTSFFRDPAAWKALKTEVIRKLAAENISSPIRVWTPACATGEEAYSIAMMLRNELDLSGKKREIQVFATDVNERALEKARDGIYPASILADVPEGYAHKFFTHSEDGQHVTISKALREDVVFARQDLLSDPPFSRLDLIICRNLLIYLEPDAQEKCIVTFHYALKNGRHLFLGNAESPGRNNIFFKSLGHKKSRLYTRVEKSPSFRMPISLPFAVSGRTSPPPKHVRSSPEIESVASSMQGSLLREFAPAAVAIDQNCDILYHNGPTNKYLMQSAGPTTNNLLELLPENLRSRIRASIYRATQEGKPVLVRASISIDEGKKRQITLRISKLKENLLQVVFREGGVQPVYDGAVPMDCTEIERTVVQQLETELSTTREELESNIEQMKSINEELQSSNEELQAANEEMETSREELQSVNEELVTVNSQLQAKIEEQDATNNDLNNFLVSTSLPILFLDLQFRIRRFTPAMSKLVKLIPADVGRPIVDLSQESLGPDLVADAESVLETLVPLRKELLIAGNWHIRSTLPYRTLDNRIEGVVIIYNDITERKKIEEELRATNEELSRFNEAAVGRELRMIELKKEINELYAQAGLSQRYDLYFTKEEP